MDRIGALVLTLAATLVAGGLFGCDRQVAVDAPAARGELPPETDARLLLVADVDAHLDADDRERLTGLRLRVFDGEARPAVDLAPGEHGVVDLPAGVHVLSALAHVSAHKAAGPAHLACVGALRADLAAGRLYAARIELGAVAEVDALLARRSLKCVQVRFERVSGEQVAALASRYPARTARRRPVHDDEARRMNDLDLAELVAGAAKLRTLADDHAAAVPRAFQVLGYEPSAAPTWSPATNALGRDDGIAVPR